jgi:O-antigen biosynthesis protein WbqV
MKILRIHSNIIAALMDSAVAGISFAAALYLRLGDALIPHAGGYLLQASLSFAGLVLYLLLLSRTYRRVWRYTSLNDLINLAKIISIALLIFYVALFQFTRLESFPRSVIFIHWLTLIALLSAGRIIARMLHDQTILGTVEIKKNRVNVLLIGASAEAEMFIRESKRNKHFPYEVVALMDDDSRNYGREIHHIRIYGPIHHTQEVIAKMLRRGKRVQRLIVCDAALHGEALSELVKIARKANLSLARLPRLSELQDGNQRFDIKPVAVEDILGRAQVSLDFDAMRALVADKRVLITGAGGSIGSELVRQIASFAPKTLILYEISEFQLYEIQQELSEDFADISLTAIVGDVRNNRQLHRVFKQYSPEIVFHAAAIKHVPMAETNPDQAVLTNVLGSMQVVDCCIAYEVGTLVQISTDKVVNPTSVMGASKRIAEIYAQMRAQLAQCHTRIITVRFGNVLGSNGSVVPLFQRQIQKGGPVTVTHPEMTRYLMTISEAVQLVLQAAAMGKIDTESAPIFVLEMGAPIKILDLAKQMIQLAGLQLDKDIHITFTGIRPGEKLYEELFHAQENLLKTQHSAIRKAMARTHDEDRTISMITALIDASENFDEAKIRAQIRALVPEYMPFQRAESDRE